MGFLEGKVAVVTGAGNGLGRSHALLFAAEGAKIVVNDIGCNRHGAGQSDAADDVVAEIKNLGGEAIANKDSVGSFESARSIIQLALDTYGKLDILINNAGILRDRTILKMTPEEWDQVVEVHLKGTFTCLQAAGRVMKKQNTGGRIVNTSSGSGLLGNFGQANYGAAKMGIQALTRIAALEFARFKVTVNAIAPVAVTRMTHDLPNTQGKVTVDEMGPDHVAPLVAFLASDAAENVTGQTFGVGGNRLFVYRMMTSRGIDKRGTNEPWTQEEILRGLERVLYF